jgi:zinc transporter 14
MSCYINSASDTNQGKVKPSSAAVWGYGILCVTAISLTSVIGVSFVPLMSKSFYNNLLSSLIGLAVGSLSGTDQNI